MKINYKWFTLMEFMVASSIIVIITLLTYIPYSHYQNKAKIKISSREISQSFYEIKNMATWWLKYDDGNPSSIFNGINTSVALYITTEDTNSNIIRFFAYPHDIQESNITNNVNSTTSLIKQKKLQDWVSFIDLWWYDNLLFFYESITWDSKIYTFNWWSKSEATDDIYDITISYKKSSSNSLKSELKYYSETNIIDYK